jgi:hypothetical protein
MAAEVETVIWEGVVGGGHWVSKVVGINNNRTRGVLKIYDLEDNELYFREVGVDYNAPFGASKANIQEWQNVISYWINNLK